MSSDIIPHKKQNVQVSIPENTDENLTLYGKQPFLGRNRVGIQSIVYALYDAGLNVLPQPYGSKGGYPWKRLQYSRLSRDHQDYGLNTLFSGECNLAIMCGKTSGNLFVIDCESPAALKYHITQLRRHRIPLWVSKTARGGHIYLRASNGEVDNIEPGILAEAEIKGRNGYVLAPPSIHPSGIVYEWLIREGTEPPTIHSSKVNWLVDQSGNRIQLNTTSTSSTAHRGNWRQPLVSPLSNLAAETRDYIECGHLIGEGSRNNRLFKAACDLCGNQYSETEAQSLLTPPALLSGLPRFEIDQTIRSAYRKQRQPSRSQSTTASYYNENWYLSLLWITQQSWQRRTGTSERTLALALVERARVSMNENGVFRASIRELAELAKLGTTTVQRSLKRLEKTFIQPRGYDINSQAALWSFQAHVLEAALKAKLNLNTVPVAPHWLRYSESLFNSDLVERAALGHSTLFVYQFLRTLDAPMMPSEIADSLGVTLNQVNYALRKLKLNRLIVRHVTGWFPVGMSVSQIEEKFPLAEGAAERRAARFRNEREVFAGRILFNARVRGEKRGFLRAVQRALEAHQMLHDPLYRLGLELGGSLALSDGTVLMADDLFC